MHAASRLFPSDPASIPRNFRFTVTTSSYTSYLYRSFIHSLKFLQLKSGFQASLSKLLTSLYVGLRRQSAGRLSSGISISHHSRFPYVFIASFHASLLVNLTPLYHFSIVFRPLARSPTHPFAPYTNSTSILFKTLKHYHTTPVSI